MKVGETDEQAYQLRLIDVPDNELVTIGAPFASNAERIGGRGAEPSLNSNAKVPLSSHLNLQSSRSSIEAVWRVAHPPPAKEGG